MPETSIPISQATLARLQELAGWAGVSVPKALEQAVNDLYERKFWEAVNAGYAALRADPAAWAAVEAERRLWDGTLLDGLDPSERWTPDGDLMPPGGQERAP
jgi:predicted transcriptional regulator